MTRDDIRRLCVSLAVISAVGLGCASTKAESVEVNRPIAPASAVSTPSVVLPPWAWAAATSTLSAPSTHVTIVIPEALRAQIAKACDNTSPTIAAGDSSFQFRATAARGSLSIDGLIAIWAETHEALTGTSLPSDLRVQVETNGAEASATYSVQTGSGTPANFTLQLATRETAIGATAFMTLREQGHADDLADACWSGYHEAPHPSDVMPIKPYRDNTMQVILELVARAAKAFR